MNRKFALMFAAICALLCGLCVSNKAFGQTLPDGNGKAEFQRICTACHGVDTATKLRKTPAEWRKTANDMVARGANGSKEDIDNVVLYLSTNFGPDQSSATAAAPSPSSQPAALNSSEIERAKHIINENGCLTCHRIEKDGGDIGPALNGVGARHTADEIRTTIVKLRTPPDPMPSFEGKIMGDDLDDLVHYLASLPSADEK
jgi:mono/diheme cytochrome c family protein